MKMKGVKDTETLQVSLIKTRVLLSLSTFPAAVSNLLAYACKYLRVKLSKHLLFH